VNLSDKRILVTGGSGFVGSFLCKKLADRGCQHVLVPRRSVASGFPPFRKYNLIDSSSVKNLYRDARPQVVIHLAAVVGGIGANRAHPGRFFYDNLMMGVQLIERARDYGVEKFVAIGTICSYPANTPIPFREDDVWNGYPEATNAPYGLAKKMMLVQSQAYRQEYGFNSIFLMPVNLYGPGDNFDLETSHVIPAIIRKCVEAKRNKSSEMVVWGTGAASREFLYVDDAAEAIALASELYDKPDPVNIGSGMEITVKALVSLIADMVGFQGEIKWDNSKPDGQMRRNLDTSRALAEFGFKAKVDFREGLKRTIDWYLQNC